MPTVTCVACEGEVALSNDVETAEIVDCAACGTELEVVGVDPVEVDEAPDLDEDWGE